MAETMGFIIGDYTIPSDTPIICITDSNNAFTLQRKMKNGHRFTHQKMIRGIKQGIDQSITNHLEYLTSKWPKEDRLSPHVRNMYKRGENICHIWAQQTNPIENSDPINNGGINTFFLNEDKENGSDASQQSDNENCIKQTINKRYRFDHSMYDCLGRVIIIKVNSHQLILGFRITIPGNKPSSNLFSVSTNQIADNSANYAYHFYETRNMCNEPDGTSHIGDDTLIQSLVKMTATCWTRCIYRYPPLANQIWQTWRTLGQNEANISNIPINIPKDWKNIPMICNNVVRACPFCKQHFLIQQKIGIWSIYICTAPYRCYKKPDFIAIRI